MKKRAIWVLGMALFSLFFGAGNLVLPPMLGFRSGELWWLVCLGFCLSAVLIPMLGILAHARLQGSMFDFTLKTHPIFGLVYCYLVYAISVTLPAPRTASVTHEMAVAPFIEIPPLLTSLIYFALVYLFVHNRSRLSKWIGQWLTPIILLVLLALIFSLMMTPGDLSSTNLISHPFTEGILEGYQTFDAIGAVVVGGVILISLKLEAPDLERRQRFWILIKAGAFAGLALAMLYGGLMVSGASVAGGISPDITRTGLLSAMSSIALGTYGGVFLSLLISLACFTTAVGIVTGTADFVSSRYGDSQKVYRFTAIVGCLLGVLMGQLPVDVIIQVALPALMLIYPLTIILILLNALPKGWSPPLVFRIVVATVLIFSIPDFMQSIGLLEDSASSGIVEIVRRLPLQEFRMGWVLPAITAYAFSMLWVVARNRKFAQ